MSEPVQRSRLRRFFRALSRVIAVLLVLGLIAAGLGCSILPASAGQRLPPGVRLVRVPDLQLHVPVNLVWRRDSHTPVIQRFAELLCGHKAEVRADVSPATP